MSLPLSHLTELTLPPQYKADIQWNGERSTSAMAFWNLEMLIASSV